MTSDAVMRLATAVSLAARVEPELLRAVRLRLFPDIDVSAEGDLWFSNLVAARSARRIVLDRELVASLRQSLANDRSLLDAARAVVEETHRNAPPAIQLEEEIVYLALTGANVEDAINTKLTSVLNAIATEGRRGLIDWAVRALPGMPAIAQNTTAAAALRLVAGGQLDDVLHVRRDPAIAALVGRTVPKTRVFARLVPQEIGLGVEISRTQLPASHEIELPKTEPLVLELVSREWSGEDGAFTTYIDVVYVPHEGTLLRGVDRAFVVRTLAGDVFRLEEVREEERTTVRILVMARLSADHLDLPDEPDIDVVLIAGASERGTNEEYTWIAARLYDRFGTTPILAVPGDGDLDDKAFLGFLARLGFTASRGDFAKTLEAGGLRIGVAGINTSLGDFEGSRIVDACGGDPLAWARSHHAAILITYNAPEHLDDEARERWEAFGTGEVFDFIATGSANTPELSEGYVVVEFPDPDGGALVSIHRRGERQVRRQEIHQRMDAMPPAQPRRVLVSASAEKVTIEREEHFRAIGSMLAFQGHDLLRGDSPGAETLIAEGFDPVDPHRGSRVYFGYGEDAIRTAVSECDVVILIDGTEETRSIGIEAIRQGKPVIPIGGGAAEQLRSVAIRPGRWGDGSIERLRRLGSPASVATLVHDVNVLIRMARPRERQDFASDLPLIAGRTWEQVLSSRNRDALVHAVIAYLPSCRWFGERGTIEAAFVLEAVELAEKAWLLMVDVDLEDRERQTYLLPLAIADDRGEREQGRDLPVVAQLSDGAMLYEPIGEDWFANALLDTIGRETESRGLYGVMSGQPTEAFEELRGTETFETHLLGAGQFSTAIQYGERLLLKLFRRLETDINPDFEMTRFLNERTSFRNVPRLAGGLEYVNDVTGVLTTFAMLQGFTLNSSDGWTHTLDSIGRYFERLTHDPSIIERSGHAVRPANVFALAQEQAPELARDFFGRDLVDAGLLGMRTAQMHLALASSTGDPAFEPEPFTSRNRDAIEDSVFVQVERAMQAAHRAKDRPEFGELLSRESELRESVLMETIGGARIRIHGDYHLGEVLYTGDDFVIIDFQGERTRPLSERRAKHSALRDVASMLRSFHYAPYAMLFSSSVHEEARAALVTGARFWHRWVSAAFLRGYLVESAKGTHLPHDSAEIEALLRAYLIEKAAAEVVYELDNRPDWVTIPIRGLLDLLE